MALAIILTLLQIAGCDIVPVVGVRDWFAYANGVKGERLGTVYDILLLNAQCDKLSVKVADEVPAITQEELDKANATGTAFIKAQFEDFQAKPYASKENKGGLSLSAKAGKIRFENRSIPGKGGQV